MKVIYYLFIPFILLSACTNEQDKIDQLKDEVIRIHDEVMPKNADINRVVRDLKSIVQDSTLSVDIRKKIRGQIVELNIADEAMSTWMAEYKPPKKGDPFDETMAKLNEEKVKIIKVKELMLSSLESGKSLLKEIKNN